VALIVASKQFSLALNSGAYGQGLYGQGPYGAALVQLDGVITLDSYGRVNIQTEPTANVGGVSAAMNDFSEVSLTISNIDAVFKLVEGPITIDQFNTIVAGLNF